MISKDFLRSPDIQIFKFILILFIGWKIILSLLGFFGLSFLPIGLPEGQTAWPEANTDYWIRWSNWDGGHFRGIAENGYLPFQVVFFPFYPLLIKSLMYLQIPSLWGGILISNLSIIGALFYLYKLVRLDFEENIAKRTVFLTLAFPTAFYFHAVYSESLFLLLAAGAFYYARTKKYFLAFFLASLSATTRLTGLVVIVAIFLEYFLKTTKLPSIKEFRSQFLNRIATYLFILAFLISVGQKFLSDEFLIQAEVLKMTGIFLILFSLILLSFYAAKFLAGQFEYKKILTGPTLFLFLSLLPFLSYCLFLYFTQNSFFAFILHEKQWERHLTFPWSAPVNYFSNLISAGFLKVGRTAQELVEFIFFIFFSIMLIISFLKFRLSYTVYFALSLLIPISTGTLQAVHRYGLVIFPVFIVLALIKNETYYQIWTYFSLTLLGLLTVLFINGYWVS